MRQRALGQAHQCVAMDTAGVGHAVFDIHRHLCRQAIMNGEDRRADDCGDARSDQCRPAHYYKDAIFLRIASRRACNPIQIAAFHSET